MIRQALVTGASSSVGYEISRQLLSFGLKVTGTVNTRSTNLSKIHSDYIELGWNELICRRLNDFILGPKSAIIHSAAVVPSRLSEHSSYKFNVQSTQYLMELALSRKVPLLIFFSTMSVYGKIGVARVEEDLVPSDSYVDTDASLDDYGRSKLDAERTLKTMASNKTKVVVVRLPGVLGRGSSYNFISETFKKLKLNIPVSIRSPFACFNNVALDSDLGRFCRELTGQYINLKPFTVVNFAASGIFSVEEAILHLKSLIGSCSKVSYSDDYGASFTICIENLRRLGFEPLTVGEALNDFVRRYDEKIFQVG